MTTGLEIQVGERVEVCEGSWIGSHGRVIDLRADRADYVMVQMDEPVKVKRELKMAGQTLGAVGVVANIVEVKACTLAAEV